MKLYEHVIPFNRPYLTGNEFTHIQEALAAGQLSGNGRFTKQCQGWLERLIGAPRVLLTPVVHGGARDGGTAADLEPGDEVIMPSFTFVSTANAFVLRGARPVFVDIRAETLNIDERLIESADHAPYQGDRRRPLCGCGVRDGRCAALAKRYGLVVIEDAAHALMSRYKGRPAGSFGHLATFSFHETKNVISGKVARWSSTIRSSSSGPKSSGRRAPTARSSHAATSTNTPGWTSAPRSCLAS
jgi:dTDP-4-amino-4,6-dideoxygalactose transaminase